MDVKSSLKKKMSRYDWISTRCKMTANSFYRIKASYYIMNKTLFAFSVMLDDDSAPLALLCSCLCVCECVMDVLLLSFEARCMLDGIRRRLKKTGSSLSVSLSLCISLSRPPFLSGWG